MPLPKNARSKVAKLYQSEKEFIFKIFQRLPEGIRGDTGNSLEDEYIIESDEEPGLTAKKAKFQQSLKQASSGRSYSHEELKRRLQEKITSLGKERTENQNSDKSVRRKKLKAKKAEALEAKKRSFTSQANPNLGGSSNKTGAKIGNSALAEKTPLQKKPVKKTNGEIVYSKFDFISDDKKPKEFTINKNAVSATKMLKVVTKTEGMIEKLKGEGKTAEAVTVADKMKWNNALQKAKGTKVRDDPALLKKTIKKQEKIKKVKDKKWKERVETKEKFMDQRQAKRQSNLQKRKDDKVKKFKKAQRKKGRIA